MPLARAASLTIAPCHTVANSSSLVISRPRCSTRCRRTAKARGASVSRWAPHHAHSFSGSIRTAGGCAGHEPPGLRHGRVIAVRVARSGLDVLVQVEDVVRVVLPLDIPEPLPVRPERRRDLAGLADLVRVQIVHVAAGAEVPG